MVQMRAAGESVWQLGGRLSRILVAFVLMIMAALAWAVVSPTRAYAADDQIDSFLIDYNMQPSGVLKVKETITWRFGSDSGRHGIQRDLVTREPDPNSDQDFVYGISNITVTSPDEGVATQFSSKTTESQGGREAELNVRIGDSNRTISAATARMLAAEAEIIPVVLGGKSQPLDLGTSRRFFSEAQRRAMAVRAGGCEGPNCDAPLAWCDAAHLKPAGWGSTSVDNGLLLCWRCHLLLDKHGWQVRRKDERWWWTPPPWVDPTGRERPGGRIPFEAPAPSQ